jgi:hypothetical protein
MSDRFPDVKQRMIEGGTIRSPSTGMQIKEQAELCTEQLGALRSSDDENKSHRD